MGALFLSALVHIYPFNILITLARYFSGIIEYQISQGGLECNTFIEDYLCH